MKYLIILTLFCCFWGCGQETPYFINNNFFVVKDITSLKDGVCSYTDNHKAVFGYESCLFCDWHPEIIAPCGMFSVGDTIKLCK